ACFGGALPPKPDVAVKRPLLPIFLRDERQHKRGLALPEATRVIAGWQQQLRVNAELNLRLLVVEKAPLHPKENVGRSDRSTGLVLLKNFNWKLQFQLYIRQSVIEIEQRRVH